MTRLFPDFGGGNSRAADRRNAGEAQRQEALRGSTVPPARSPSAGVPGVATYGGHFGALGTSGEVEVTMPDVAGPYVATMRVTVGPFEFVDAGGVSVRVAVANRALIVPADAEGVNLGFEDTAIDVAGPGGYVTTVSWTVQGADNVASSPVIGIAASALYWAGGA